MKNFSKFKGVVKSRIKNALRVLFKPIGLDIVNSTELQSIRELEKFENHTKYKYLSKSNSSQLPSLIKFCGLSASQLCQDLFVLERHDFKRAGYFVEFGATNGRELSNTWILESEFGWTGILAEPAKTWREALIRNRPKSTLDFRCVWNKSGLHVSFTEVATAELSTISEFSDEDLHLNARRNHIKYEVETVTLRDLLIQNNAPKVIDYLSIDTEGSEFAILSAFDFNEYQIKVITCEHNYGPQREEIFELLSRYGYVRIHEDISLFDDWYIKNN